MPSDWLSQISSTANQRAAQNNCFIEPTSCYLNIFASIQKSKGTDHLGPSLGHLCKFLGSTWDRKLKFSANLGLSVTSQNFSSFRQLFFIVSKGVPKEKNSFSFGPLLETVKKRCLKELKICEVSENPKSNICWKIQLSISCGTQKSSKMPQTEAKIIWSFFKTFKLQWISNLQRFFPKFCGLLRIRELYRGGQFISKKNSR